MLARRGVESHTLPSTVTEKVDSNLSTFSVTASQRSTVHGDSAENGKANGCHEQDQAYHMAAVGRAQLSVGRAARQTKRSVGVRAVACSSWCSGGASCTSCLRCSF